MAFKQLNKIDKRTKYSVHGWIRNKEKSLRLTTIPSMINAICILYFRDDEIFDVINDENVKLSANKKIITKFATRYFVHYNNYGIMEIAPTSNLIYQWDLRIVRCNDTFGIIFGITSNQKARAFKDGYHFAFSNGKKTKPNEFWQLYGKKVTTGDIASIHLDFKKGQIKLIINGTDQGIAYGNIDAVSKDIKYRLFVCLNSKNDSVEILNFSKQ